MDTRAPFFFSNMLIHGTLVIRNKTKVSCVAVMFYSMPWLSVSAAFAPCFPEELSNTSRHAIRMCSSFLDDDGTITTKQPFSHVYP
mmetsp:Transcript_25793/g.36387  ORF Transcript_25793/g.36387 Transcript_25793/m.36387 type:complete len:86 (-) Transcript_25793:61-318(-)